MILERLQMTIFQLILLPFLELRLLGSNPSSLILHVSHVTLKLILLMNRWAHAPNVRCFNLYEKLSARLYLQHGENYLNLSAFDDILNSIAQSDDITPSTLLNASPFTLTYVNNIIVSVHIDSICTKCLYKM